MAAPGADKWEPLVNPTIRIRVLLFARLVDETGKRELELSMARGATVSDALNALCEQYPQIAAARSSVAAALNDVYAPASRELSDGDVLALIPPVSGG